MFCYLKWRKEEVSPILTIWQHLSSGPKPLHSGPRNNLLHTKISTQPSRSLPMAILKATKKTQSVAGGDYFWLKHTFSAISQPEILLRGCLLSAPKDYHSKMPLIHLHGTAEATEILAWLLATAKQYQPSTTLHLYYFSGITHSGADYAAPASDPSQAVASFSGLCSFNKTTMSPRTNIWRRSFHG